jgi:hypothetical protein
MVLGSLPLATAPLVFPKGIGKCPETSTVFALKPAHLPPILHSGTKVPGKAAPHLAYWNGMLEIHCKSEDSVKQNLYNYVGESTSTFASEKGPPLAL